MQLCQADYDKEKRPAGTLGGGQEMGLRRKTFAYSIILAGLMTAFVLGYFVLMLPSLYVDYVMKSNLDSIKKVQLGYMEERSYDGLAVKNPSSVVTLEFPDAGYDIYMKGKFFSLTAGVRDEELQGIMDDAREAVDRVRTATFPDTADHGKTPSGRDKKDTDDEVFQALFARLQERLQEIFSGQNLFPEDFPVEITMERKEAPGIYREEYTRIHVDSDTVIYESSVSDGDYRYTTYTAMGWTKDAFIVTYMPTMTPQIGEISPIVRSSLPMITAVIFLMVLISSRFFAGRIVNPIIRLADSAQSAAIGGIFEREEFDSGHAVHRMDEIGALERNLQELYAKLRDNYRELECKNHLLEEENERQEVFLRASSHQLKTPVAAALLLVEGMMNKVGKYKDTQAYLPEVKKQLLAMRRIVEDILYLNHCIGNMQKEPVVLRELLQEMAGSYGVQAEDRGVYVEAEGDGIVEADREMLRIIVDNLLSNAVQYTPEGRRVVLRAADGELSVTNYGAKIDEKLLPNIFDPFVTSDTGQRGKGLGLYVAAYYCRRMGCRLEVANMERESGVHARVLFDPGKEISAWL